MCPCYSFFPLDGSLQRMEQKILTHAYLPPHAQNDTKLNISEFERKYHRKRDNATKRHHHNNKTDVGK